MRRYLVEAYSARSADTGELESRARDAAASVTRSGGRVRHLTTIHIPEDEVSFHLFEADSADAVRLASERAAFATQRIVEAAS